MKRKEQPKTCMMILIENKPFGLHGLQRFKG